MTPEEFDAAIYDLVNFLAYTAEPMAADRQRIGIFALLFISLFFRLCLVAESRILERRTLIAVDHMAARVSVALHYYFRSY